MKKLKSNSFKKSFAVLTFAVILLVVVCAKKAEASSLGNSSATISEQKEVLRHQTPPPGPLILVSSVTVGTAECAGGKQMIVNLDALTCSYYINGGAGSLYFTWRTTSCTGTVYSSTARNVCSPGFCLPSGTYYLVVSTGVNGTGSGSPCYTVVVP